MIICAKKEKEREREREIQNPKMPLSPHPSVDEPSEETRDQRVGGGRGEAGGPRMGRCRL
jgi:hypothetical protein